MAKRKRKGVSTRMRFEIFKRDHFTCQYCGRTPPQALLEIDHIVAVANGGDNDDLNLITSCLDCNRGKSDVPLSQIPRALADQVEERRVRHAQVEAYNEFLMEIRLRHEEHIADLGTRWYDEVYPSERGKWTWSADRRSSIRQFLSRLPAADILEAIDIAMSRYPPYRNYDNRTWRYFCGVCWRKIREREGDMDD